MHFFWFTRVNQGSRRSDWIISSPFQECILEANSVATGRQWLPDWRAAETARQEKKNVPFFSLGKATLLPASVKGVVLLMDQVLYHCYVCL